MLVRDHLKIILANLPNSFESAEPTIGCERKRVKRTRTGHLSLSGGTIIFEVKHAVCATENWWDWDKQHCVSAISGVGPPVVEWGVKERQQHGPPCCVPRCLLGCVSKSPFISPENLCLLFTALTFKNQVPYGWCKTNCRVLKVNLKNLKQLQETHLDLKHFTFPSDMSRYQLLSSTFSPQNKITVCGDQLHCEVKQSLKFYDVTEIYKPQ